MKPPLCPHCRQEMKVYQQKPTHTTYWCLCRPSPTWHNQHIIERLQVKVIGKEK